MNNANDCYELNPSESRIHWTQVLSLLTLDLAILLSWIAYNEYQPQLVAKLGNGFLVPQFLALQVSILVLTPPFAGYLTDQLLARGVGRLVAVNLGISLAAMLFMAVAFALSGFGSGLPAALLQCLVVLWLVAMNIFHAPALSMLEMCAPSNLLSGVAAIFTLLSGLVGALEPSVVPLINSLGAPATFATGGLVLLLSGIWFLRSGQGLEQQQVKSHAAAPETSSFGWIAAMGLALGLGETLMNDLLPAWIARNGDLLSGLGPPGQSSLLYVLVALAALPSGAAGNQFKAERLARISGMTCLALGMTAWCLPAGIARIALWLFPVPYSVLAVVALPVTFGRLTPRHKVLGVGLLFSGVELAGGLIKIALAS
ncbi:MAG: hypothetical protein ACXW1Z_23320 [Methylobacter sp.]